MSIVECLHSLTSFPICLDALPVHLLPTSAGSTNKEGEMPVGTGRRDNCLFGLHTHGDRGLLHVEAAGERDFKLGQFSHQSVLSDVWRPPSSTQPLDSRTCISGNGCRERTAAIWRPGVDRPRV